MAFSIIVPSFSTFLETFSAQAHILTYTYTHTYAMQNIIETNSHKSNEESQNIAESSWQKNLSLELQVVHFFY